MMFSALASWLYRSLHPTMSDREIYSRLPHDLCEDQQMSSPQTRNKINLVFSEGSKCKRRMLKSQAIWYAFVKKKKICFMNTKDRLNVCAKMARHTQSRYLLLMCFLSEKCKCFSPFVLFFPLSHRSQSVTWLTPLFSKKALRLMWLKQSFRGSRLPWTPGPTAYCSHDPCHLR